MKELQEILKKISDFAPDEKAILATVVDVVGSGYRRPGARMIIDKNGYSIGTVSGGCLEADVLERAKKVLQTGEPTVITYDTTKDENSIFGLGMGCRGIVRILLESVSSQSELFEQISLCFKERKPFIVSTVIESTNPNVMVGSRLFFDQRRIDSDEMKEEINEELRNCLLTRKPFHKTIEFGEIFVEPIFPPLSLLLFGVGYDAIPLIKFAKELGWKVTAIDHRPAYANTERVPEADEIIVSSSEDLSEAIFQDENSVGVIMTHNYERDRNILHRLLHSNCQYVGALGPKKRTEKLLAEIGENFNDEQLTKLHAPIGLDIGAETPEEIALAIIAEIKSVLASRNGGFLRNRQGSIYGRSE